MKRWSATGRRGRVARRWIFAIASCAVAGNVAAESVQSAGPGGAASAVAHVSFQVIIPSVIWVDAATGTVYSNDRKYIVRLGSMDAALRPAQGLRRSEQMSGRAEGCALVAAASAPRFAAGRMRTPDATPVVAGLYRLSHAEAGCVLATP